MWRNADVLDFVGWLREHNDEQASKIGNAGFTGSIFTVCTLRSKRSWLILDKVDPEAAKRARHHYSCFEHFGKKIETYGYAAGFGLAPTCEEAVVNELVASAAQSDGLSAARRPGGGGRILFARNKMRSW